MAALAKCSDYEELLFMPKHFILIICDSCNYHSDDFYFISPFRFGVGLGFSIIYGSLLTKTNRISRIFDSARRSARRPSFISPKSQMVITCMLISVQVRRKTVPSNPAQVC